MDHVLTEYGLRLTYLCDANAIDELDQDRILDDLTDDAPDGDPLPWLTRYRLADYDHLVLVTDRSSGRYLRVPCSQRRRHRRARTSCCWRPPSSPRQPAART